MTSERRLDNWIEAWMQCTENTEPPDSFRLWTAISIIASALQRKCFVPWGPSLIYYPNMYIILVGPAGKARKGTAMSPGLDMLQDLGKVKIAAQATSLQALIRRLKDTNFQSQDKETGALHFHSSMTVYSKEFTVFLGYHNRELMSALCDWYDCDKIWKYETISRKVEEIVGVWVNLYGATTPALIQSSLPLDAIGGGLTSRIIYIYEEDMGKMVFLPMETEAEVELRIHLLHDLDKIHNMSGQFKWTEDFMNAWIEWRTKDRDNPPFHNEIFGGYMSRRPTHVMKLSMIMSAADGTRGGQLILIEDDLRQAVAVLEKAEEKMENVFRGVGKSDISELLHRVLTYVKASSIKEIPVFQLARHFQSDMDKFTMERIFHTLETMKVIRVVSRPQADDYVKVLE